MGSKRTAVIWNDILGHPMKLHYILNIELGQLLHHTSGSYMDEIGRLIKLLTITQIQSCHWRVRGNPSMNSLEIISHFHLEISRSSSNMSGFLWSNWTYRKVKIRRRRGQCPSSPSSTRTVSWDIPTSWFHQDILNNETYGPPPKYLSSVPYH